MNKIVICFVALVMCVATMFAAENKDVTPAGFPEYSWDSVQVALHFSKRKDFTEDEIKFLARFPLFCVEKNQGLQPHNDVRKGAFVVKEQIKKYNPNAKILFYWNSRIDTGEKYFGANTLDEGQHPEWAQVGIDGKLILTRGTQKNYDPANPELRKWWVSIPVNAVAEGDMDGVLIDAIQQHIIRPGKQLDKEGLAKAVAGVEMKLADLQQQLGDKIILYNNMNVGNDHNTGLSKYSNGGMMEHFCDRPSYTPDYMVMQIETVQTAARLGRIVVTKCWPRYDYRKPEGFKGVSQETIYEHCKEDIEFPLACFLIAAGKYSYFCYSYGYSEKHGNLFDYPEYHKPLGEPEGEAIRDGYKFSRKFKHADVWINLETREGEINWK